MADGPRGGLLCGYLIVGADELKQREALTRLKGRLDPGLELFNLDERQGSAEIEPGELLTSLNTLPMGAGFRLVVIHDAEKLPKAVSEALVSYLGDPNPSTVVCVLAKKLAKNTRLYKALQKQGPKAVIDCTPKRRWELGPTIQRMARRYGVTIDAQAADELVSRVGESTTMLDMQVRTLADLCRAQGAITRADVERHIARTAEVKPWDFLDAVSGRDAARALSLLRLMHDQSALGLLSLLTGRIRELICARSLSARGQQGGIAHELGKQGWQVKNHARWARLYADGELERALASCRDAERALKGGADERGTLTDLVIGICG